MERVLLINQNPCQNDQGLWCVWRTGKAVIVVLKLDDGLELWMELVYEKTMNIFLIFCEIKAARYSPVCTPTSRYVGVHTRNLTLRYTTYPPEY